MNPSRHMIYPALSATALLLLATGLRSSAQEPAAPAGKRATVPMVGMGAPARPAAREAVAPPRTSKASLALVPDAFSLENMKKYGLKYFPKTAKLSPEKPAGITKEPAYKGTPRYGVVRVGNGPKADHFLVVDDAGTDEGRFWVDANANGDLTDDEGADGQWAEKRATDGGTFYGMTPRSLRASYGTAERETGSAPYVLNFYRRHGSDTVNYVRSSARAGDVFIAGKKRRVLLVENDSDGVYDKALLDPDADPRKGLPVWLLFGPNDDEAPSLGARTIDVRSPFVLAGHNYEVVISPDGSRFTLAPTSRAVYQAPPVTSPPPTPGGGLLAAGSVAPDFAADRFGGGGLKLSDYKGKVVVLDFWATWCGPCQASMPHLQEVTASVKDQGVAVVALCVSDERDAYQQWVEKNRARYGFDFAYDPAGRDSEKTISRSLFGVTGIPTTYVIDRDGKVVASVVGFSGEKDRRIEEALAKAGIQVPAKAAAR